MAVTEMPLPTGHCVTADDEKVGGSRGVSSANAFPVGTGDGDAVGNGGGADGGGGYGEGGAGGGGVGETHQVAGAPQLECTDA